MHKRVIHALHKNVPEDTIYFVKPSSVTVKMNLDYLAFLDGAYSNIPMKNCYFDLLVVIGLPKWNRLEAMVRECHRVSKQNGRLAILTPTFLISSYEDPLTIGEFVEKYEHETIRKDEQQFGKAFIQEMLRKYFKKVAESHIVHMTIFIASEPCSLRQ